MLPGERELIPVRKIVPVKGNLKTANPTLNIDTLKSTFNYNNFKKYFTSTSFNAEDILDYWKQLKDNSNHGVVTYGEKTYLDREYNEKKAMKNLFHHSTKLRRVVVTEKKKIELKPIEKWTLSDFGTFFINKASLYNPVGTQINHVDILSDQAQTKNNVFLVSADDANLNEFMEQLEHRVKIERKAQGVTRVELYLWHRTFTMNPKELVKISIANMGTFLSEYETFIQIFKQRWILVCDLTVPKVIRSNFCLFEMQAIRRKNCYYSKFFCIQLPMKSYLTRLADVYETHQPRSKAELLVNRLTNICIYSLNEHSFVTNEKFAEYYSQNGGFSQSIEATKDIFLNLIAVDFVNKYFMDLAGVFNTGKRKFPKKKLLKDIMILGIFLRRLNLFNASYELFTLVSQKALDAAYVKRNDQNLFQVCLFYIRKGRSALACEELDETRALIKKVKINMDSFGTNDKSKTEIHLLVLVLMADLNSKEANQFNKNKNFEKAREKYSLAISLLESVQLKINAMQNDVHKASVKIRGNKGRRPSLFLSDSIFEDEPEPSTKNEKLGVDTRTSPRFRLASKKIKKSKPKKIEDVSMTISFNDLINLETEANSILIVIHQLWIKLGDLKLKISDVIGAKGSFMEAKDSISLYQDKSEVMEAQITVKLGDCSLARNQYALAFKMYVKAYRIYRKNLGKCNPKTIRVGRKLMDCNRLADHDFENLVTKEIEMDLKIYETVCLSSNNTNAASNEI